MMPLHGLSSVVFGLLMRSFGRGGRRDGVRRVDTAPLGGISEFAFPTATIASSQYLQVQCSNCRNSRTIPLKSRR